MHDAIARVVLLIVLQVVVHGITRERLDHPRPGFTPGTPGQPGRPGCELSRLLA